jgi:signal transduction histidine kinase
MKLIHSWLRVISVDVSKLKEGFQPLSVAGVLAKAIETVQPHATRKAIEIQPAVAEPLAGVNGDEGSLTEVFVNLLTNAVKYSFAEGKILVCAEQQDEQVVVSVTDTGVGMVPEDLPFIFQGFVRGRAQPEGVAGCGLGLAISRQIVEAHAGSISVESEPGKGSTFVVRLPALKTPSPAQSVPSPGKVSNP